MFILTINIVQHAYSKIFCQNNALQYREVVGAKNHKQLESFAWLSDSERELTSLKLLGKFSKSWISNGRALSCEATVL